MLSPKFLSCVMLMPFPFFVSCRSDPSKPSYDCIDHSAGPLYYFIALIVREFEGMGKCIPPLCGGVYLTKRTFGAKIVRSLQVVNHPIHKIEKIFMLSRHLGFQRVIFDC